MLEKKIWAVIGANNDSDKFGNIIYKKLKCEGYKVYPVNPMCEYVDGNRCYPNLSSLPEMPEVLDMVVSPKKRQGIHGGSRCPWYKKYLAAAGNL